MTIATGFAAIRAFLIGEPNQKEGADYKNRDPGGKEKARKTGVNLAKSLGKRSFTR
jgi:hypothetical protein